jgi:hypothetical protein
MTPDRNLRKPFVWRFSQVEGPAGTWWWRWRQVDSQGNVTQESGRSFELYLECIEDARAHGYCPQ